MASEEPIEIKRKKNNLAFKSIRRDEKRRLPAVVLGEEFYKRSGDYAEQDEWN